MTFVQITVSFLLGQVALFANVASGSSVDVSGAPGSCVFCLNGGTDKSTSFDLSSLPTDTFQGSDGQYLITTPCGRTSQMQDCDPMSGDPVLQQCRGLGSIANFSINYDGTSMASGFNLTLFNGSNDPPCGPAPGNRVTIFRFVCDEVSYRCKDMGYGKSLSAPTSNPPDDLVVEYPSCHYVVTWRHPAACAAATPASGQCKAAAPPAPPPLPCATCLPTWKPTWNMQRSTFLYTCNDTGLHSVDEAVKYGVAAYDWSNAKQLWANTKPMNDEEMLTQQAEMVLKADPGIPGEQPRVWVYRNTIKALNWYTSVRVKLDDPQYAGWFVKFKDYKGPASNHSYHVPACTYEKCSGFYHDQEQTPEHPRGDGSCVDECDCGKAPCGEYIFDHRNESFADWFINGYMITNETLLHTPIGIGLSWLDDSMKITGPTEEDSHFINDTGSSAQDMKDHVAAYHTNMWKLQQKLIPMGGYYMQLIHERGPQVRKNSVPGKEHNVTVAQCIDILRTQYCVPEPDAWKHAALYQVLPQDAAEDGENYTAEFLLTRGPYAWLGYSWVGCSSDVRPRPAQWDVDYGVPEGPCSETGPNTGIFERKWSKATAQWDCTKSQGTIRTSVYTESD